ncbi:SOS response-associated peptidase (plasmid) [Glaciihabitans sp. INWT7]|uniref:SOS response-associated peptidase n=1 Tax=Glaciihabitans sp. INWT7 TaxID=2596912 RepID=UPI001627EBAF|nr:SOS response-associated peptidase [Glaciihabitans sp. INWT7]QNE48703.1 SOS response-associated peptidase [Glaciihabitans sp. INWT7]
MCGRFSLDKSTDELISEYVATGGDFRNWRPGWNIAPTQTIPVLLETAKGEAETLRRLEPARWSLTPTWSKTLTTKFPTFNARSEGITQKATWKGPVKTHRAIIPASGYYEWQTDPATKKKTPFYIHPADGELMNLAGLYSWWKDTTKAEDEPGLWTLTATILTSDAVEPLSGIHDRNPVPLPREWVDDWLNPEIEGDQKFVDDAVHAAVLIAEALDIRQVRPLRGNGPELVEPVDSGA